MQMWQQQLLLLMRSWSVLTAPAALHSICNRIKNSSVSSGLGQTLQVGVLADCWGPRVHPCSSADLTAQLLAVLILQTPHLLPAHQTSCWLAFTAAG